MGVVGGEAPCHVACAAISELFKKPKCREETRLFKRGSANMASCLVLEINRLKVSTYFENQNNF